MVNLEYFWRKEKPDNIKSDIIYVSTLEIFISMLVKMGWVMVHK